MKNTNINYISLFIINNKLNFDDSGSALNSNCVIICGYALYIGANATQIIESLVALRFKVNRELELEITRVYTYAEKNMYEKFWNTEAAKKQYIF